MALPVAANNQQLIQLALESLPTLTAEDLVDVDDSCPICLTSFTSLFLDEEPNAGVTKLNACNHVFCRKDLTQWIQSLHGNCPTCRHTFLDIRPPSESDDESSDGGEYIPNEHDEDFDDDDDIFIDTDGFSDAIEFAVEEMELDLDDLWESQAQYAEVEMEDTAEDMDDDELEWGLTDGESSMSEGYNCTPEGEEGSVNIGVSVSVHGNDDNEASYELQQEEPK